MKSTLTFDCRGQPARHARVAQSPSPGKKGERRRYHLTDLGPVGPPTSQPYFIANTGLTAGTAAASDGTVHAVLWYRGEKVDIGTRGARGPNSQAFGVNERGQVVGEAQSAAVNSKISAASTHWGFGRRVPHVCRSCGKTAL